MDGAPRPPAAPDDDAGSRPSVDVDPYLGRTLGGTYRIVSRLGKGASGVVYLARHTLLDQEFAVKVLAPELAKDADVRRRLLLEARSLTLFAHRHAVQVRHCGEDGGALFLAMDLCRGETLASLVEREGPLSEERAARIVLQALEALGEAHAAGIVHRDLKPSNVMVETTTGSGGAPADRSVVDRVRILDFGLARLVGSERAALPGALASFGGSVVGTVAYMSPEQLRAEEDVDGRSDLFSLGVVFYELVGGVLPFHAASTMSIALKILEQAPPPLPDAGPHGVSAPLRAAIGRALEKDRRRRFQTAAEFSDAVKAALRGIAPPPLPPPTVELTGPSPRWTRRLVVAAAVAAVIGVSGWLLFVRGPSATDHSSTQDAETAAERAAAEGRWTDAISSLSSVIARGHGTGDVYLARARARIEANDSNARSDLDEAARLLGEDPRVLTERGRFLWSVLKPPEFDAARTAFEGALAVSPGYTDARFERAKMFAEQKKWQDAEIDLESVERAAPRDPRAPLLRALMATNRAEAQHALAGTLSLPKDEREKAFAAAEALSKEARDRAKAAADLDPAWAEGPAQLSRALAVWAYVVRDHGDHDRARGMFEEAKAAATEAVARARAGPGHRAQGRTVLKYVAQRAGVFMSIDDYASASAEWEEILKATPNDPYALLEGAYAHMETGRYEEAIREYERLSAISTEIGHQEYLAFCYQRVGVDAATVGDRKKAVDQYTKAIEQYGRVMARSGGDDADHAYRNYRAETYVMRAKVGGEATRQRDLDAAKADFDAMSRPDGSIVTPHGDPDGETLHRRFDYWMEVGEPWKALDDIRAAIGDEKGKNASFYLRRARGALEVDSRESEAPFATPNLAVLAEAREAADLAGARAPEVTSVALTLRGRAWTQEAEVGDPDARATSLRHAFDDLAEALKTARERSQTAEAHHWLAEARRVGGEIDAAVAEAREAVRIREEEHRAGRWTLSSDYYRRLADALDDAKKSDEARAARARADEIDAEAKAPPR